MRTLSFSIARSAIVGAGVLMLASFAGSAFAADGDLITTIIADRTGTACASIDDEGNHAGIGTGIAFDGTVLYMSCWTDSSVVGIDPADGDQLSLHFPTPATRLGAMAWDANANQLWACDDDTDIGIIDLDTDTFTSVFAPSGPAPGCIDGLAYDGSDNTIWASRDVSDSIQHYQLDGTLIDSFSLTGLIGAAGSSGIAVGTSGLYLANNGGFQIWHALKDLSASTLFATFERRLEDLECDPITFSDLGVGAIWSQDAYDNIVNAYEVSPDECPFGGGGGLYADIDIKFCSNPNGFNCKSGGVMPMTVFGSNVLDVQTIDLATVQLCLADDSACIDAESLRNAVYVDRGTADDVGADECAINEETGEEEYFLNPDGLADLELAWEKKDVVETLFDDCDGFGKKEASPTLVFKALTYDGVPVSSTPLDDPGIDQVWRQK